MRPFLKRMLNWRNGLIMNWVITFLDLRTTKSASTDTATSFWKTSKPGGNRALNRRALVSCARKKARKRLLIRSLMISRRPCSSACAREIIRLLINKRFLAFLRAQDTSARRFSARFPHGFEVFQKDVAVSVDALLVVLKSRNVMTQFIIKPFLQFSILFRKGRILRNQCLIARN